jgi:ligand-binding sensor domain-containing protein/signal transduction histidine kinase
MRSRPAAWQLKCDKMRKCFWPAMVIFLLQHLTDAGAQQLKFNRVSIANPNGISNWGGITAIAQDRQGYVWFSMNIGGGQGGLCRYDGSKIISFSHDSRNSNSLANNWAECMIIDSSGMVWIGTYGSGLNRYDPSTNTFTLFHHDANNFFSLANDTIIALLEDHKGNLWVGTYSGLDLLDAKTGRFIHYANKRGDATSLSYNHVRVIYEDREGTLWVGCGSPWLDEPDFGGLNRFNRTTGTFTRYLHSPADPNSIVNNHVRALLEDRKGNFWVGTAGDGLQIMDRSRGTFTHYYYDSTHPEKLSRPPLYHGNAVDHITFIKEDIAGTIWIGTFEGGINRYDPNTKKLTHYGIAGTGGRPLVAQDSAAGVNDYWPWAAFTSKDGLFWITTLSGNLYNVNPLKTEIPYHNLNAAANSFYKEPGKNILWIATDKGLMRIDRTRGIKKIWRHEPLNNANSLCNDTINVLRVDDEGKFWLATNNGLSKFDPVTNRFINYRHNEKDSNSLNGNRVYNVFIDHDRKIWIGTYLPGLNELDPRTNKFRHFDWSKNNNATNSDFINYISEDQNQTLWIGTGNGITRLDKKDMHFRHYWRGSSSNSTLVSNIICIDAKGDIWSGSYDGLYRFDKASDDFLHFEDPTSRITIGRVLHILEDNKHNLWVATENSIVKINEQRDEVRFYGSNYGIHYNKFSVADNFVSGEGELFFGDQRGYYSCFPDELRDSKLPPLVNLSAFKIRDKEIKPSRNGVLKAPVWETDQIELKYNQNVFSFDFTGTHYDGQGDLNYLFMLENYNDSWHNIGADHTAYFFNVPPGNYIFHAKAIAADGAFDEKKISIIITPPWYKTWWAYAVYSICILLIAFYTNRIVRSRIVEKERRKNREKELAHAKEIEKAYHKLEQAHEALKSTEAQLIQSEKMASLGELTAGIAHEIQNPLNFVNNFAEVNKELIDDMQKEMAKGNFEEAEAISNNIKDNEEKVMSHGRRADAIVKSMLQHSRTSSGKKELTDVNALVDEYLRLAYHGMRAKDKSFNATFRTEFDPLIDKINVVPQEIGKVVLNLINNAFYIVNEKAKQNISGFEPTVIVVTKKLNRQIQINVRDNGNGVPNSIKEKIFQPFFTTKPAGRGTGLGLSLAYDIVKAHGGDIIVRTKEGEGSEFSVQLPVKVGYPINPII